MNYELKVKKRHEQEAKKNSSKIGAHKYSNRKNKFGVRIREMEYTKKNA